ncbi:TnsA endonuclease N-terminal domain-containing protein [Streptomyces albofaciens]|uniref:TnsA endonuclease N-terminal domain-containing protein n=1 Tax=Streptomyces albofaciens TaxID=66866 RepID=UPI00123C04C8|nr:TnsA endonuclease N-terminal domain-containing protein [Streptomyces albofaciens]
MDGTGSADGAGPAVPERRGLRWDLAEFERLVAGIGAGASLEELGAGHQRGVSGMRWAVRQLVPPEEASDGEAAAAWLARRPADGPYDWQARLEESRRARAAGKKDRAAGGRRARPEACEPATVVALWQEVTGHRLSPGRRAEFLDRATVRDLTAHPEETLRPVARRLWQAYGHLLLDAWLLDTVCPGYATADLSWEAVADGVPDTATVLRDLAAASVDELRDARAHAVLCRRLGLDGHDPRSQPAIAQEFSLSAQRISQLQARGVARMLGGRRPATLAWREALGTLLGEDRPHAAERLLTIAETAFPGAPLNPAGLLPARLAGKDDAEARRLLKEAAGVLAERRKEERRRRRLADRAERASARWAALASAADWFGAPGAAPDPAELTALREVNPREHSGTWYSQKLGREVQYESQTELQVIHLLDHAGQIARYQEQPLAIGYRHAGRTRSYYPDFLAVTTEGHAVLIEAKPQCDIPLAVNLAKYRAAAGLCARNGWGLLITDGTRTLRDLERHPVATELEQRLRAALDTRELTWPDVRDITRGTAFTSLDLAALVLRNGWQWELGPYRLRAGSQPFPKPRAHSG